jgi:hypothetical protein
MLILSYNQLSTEDHTLFAAQHSFHSMKPAMGTTLAQMLGPPSKL